MEESRIKKISVVVPVYNEEENIKEFYEELNLALENINKNYEIIFVDDCSEDSSLEILEEIFKKNSRVQVVSLLGNQGQTMALGAGFKVALGDVVVAMDGDGQHDPKYISQFVGYVEEGYDIASGWKRKDKGSNKIKFLLSKIAHKIIGRIMGVRMNYFGATMKAYKSEIVRSLDLSGDFHRFIGALVYYKGIKIKEIPIEIRPRKKGSSNYSFGKILKVALDLILLKFLTKYSKMPFRIFGSLGVFFSALGVIGVSYIYILKYAFGQSAAQNVAGLVISAIFFIIGIQFVFFGLMAEMISRIYYTSGNKEFFNIRFHLRH